MEKDWNLGEVKYSFYQAGNTNGSTEDTEEIEVTLESVASCLTEASGFLTIRTKGWSVNNVEELLDLLKIVKP